MTNSEFDLMSTEDAERVLRICDPNTISLTALDVGQFRIANGLHIGEEPDSTQADLPLHKRLLAEEFTEFILALEEKNPEKLLDALADIVYVTYGVALDAGYDLDGALNRVHAANMRKLGPDGNPIIDEDGKVQKPEGWTPPDLSDLVEKK